MMKTCLRLGLSALLLLAASILAPLAAAAQTAPQNGAVLILDHSSQLFRVGWDKLVRHRHFLRRHYHLLYLMVKFGA